MALLFGSGSIIHNQRHPLLWMQDSQESSTQLHLVVGFHSDPNLHGCGSLHISKQGGHSDLWCLNSLHLFRS